MRVAKLIRNEGGGNCMPPLCALCSCLSDYASRESGVLTLVCGLAKSALLFLVTGGIDGIFGFDFHNFPLVTFPSNNVRPNMIYRIRLCEPRDVGLNIVALMRKLLGNLTNLGIVL